MATASFMTIPLPPQPAGFEPPAFGERLPRFEECAGGDALALLAAADITCLCAGSVGRPAIEHLARMGVGFIRIADKSAFKGASLITHSGVFADEIGISKAASAGAMCRRINPRARVLVYNGEIEKLPPAALIGTNAVLLASDNLQTEIHVGRLCAQLGLPLIQMSVHGETLLSHIRIFMNRGGGAGGACPRCLYGQAEEEHFRNGRRFSCDGSAIDVPPTMSVSALCATAAAMGATLALRHLLKLGRPLEDSLHQWCGYTGESHITPIARRHDCPESHEPWTLVPFPRPLYEASLRDIAAACGLALGAPIDFEIDSLLFAEKGLCRCGRMQPLGRWVAATAAPVACDTCGQPLHIPQVYAFRRVPAQTTQPWADVPLAKISPGFGAASVTVRDASRTWLVFDQNTGSEESWR